MKRSFLLTAILLITATTLCAQPAVTQRTFSVCDGLPANGITAIHQDVKGLIWIATWNGLCCYDGYRFTTFRGNAWGKDNTLSTNRISVIKPDSKGNIWVITYDGGLYFFDTQRCQFFDVKQMLKQEYGVDIKAHNIHATSNGHIWIIDKSEQMNLRIDDQHPLDVKSMEIWGSKGKPLKGSVLQKVETDRKGHEWLITDEGMMRYGSKEFHENVFTLADLSPQLVAPNPNEALQRNAKEYIEQHNIRKYCIDRQGNLWYTMPRGTISLVNFNHYNTHLIPLEADQETRAILCRKDGSIWAGTKDGYLRVYRPESNSEAAWVSPSGAITNSRVRFSDYIYALCEDHEGRLWIGTKGNGLYVMAPGSPTKHYVHQEADAYSLSNDNIYDIHEDQQGNMWIGTYGGGVNLIRGEKLEVRGESEPLRFLHSGNEMKRYPKEDFLKIRRITHDQQGNIIASTTSGLMTFRAPKNTAKEIRFYTTQHLQNDTTSLWSEDVLQTLVTRDGRYFVVTMGGGIQQIISDQLQQDDLKLRIIDAMNQGAGNALSLTEDLQGYIWITRETEINRYDTKKNTLEQFGPNSMEGPANMTEAKSILSPDGSLWVGTTGGLLTFKTKDMQKSHYKPEIIFSTIQYQGEQREHPLVNRSMLDVMEESQRNLTIRFAALDYENNYLMQYAYRMKEDESKNWNYIGQTPRISFSKLSPGWHTIIVKSTNADGVWCDNETEFTLYVQPTLWERGWFKLIVFLLIIAFCTWAVFRIIRYRQHQKEREKRLENIMRQYRELQESFKGQEIKSYTLTEPEIIDPDKEMMDKLMAYIEKRISDENLKIDDMADAVGLGRTVFYGKVKELLGVSPSDFLKQIRMQRAEQLISKSKMNFSEIAYSVGFTDPKYFTKCFKKMTGKTPSEYRTENHE